MNFTSNGYFYFYLPMLNMGISADVVLALVVAVIILILVSPLLIKVVAKVWDQVAESLGIVKYSPIEKALICYYYLCRSNEGCRDPTFNDFCGPQKIGREVYEEVCSLPSSLGIDGKQCGVFQFPIRLQLNEDAEVFRDRLKKKIDTNHVVIVTERSKGTVDWGELAKLLATWVIPPLGAWTFLQILGESVTYIYFPASNLGEIEKESYRLVGGAAEVQDAVRFAKVKSGTYYISGAKLTGSPYIPDLYFILVENSPRYLNLTSSSCKDVHARGDDIIRISVEDEKSEALKDYNYVMKIGASTDFQGNIRASIEFLSVGLDKQVFTCSNCKGKEFDFKTKKKRIIKVRVEETRGYKIILLFHVYEVVELHLKVCLPP